MFSNLFKKPPVPNGSGQFLLDIGFCPNSEQHLQFFVNPWSSCPTLHTGLLTQNAPFATHTSIFLCFEHVCCTSIAQFKRQSKCGCLKANRLVACLHSNNRDEASTVNVEIFVATIFHGLNFRTNKFSWVRVAHENLTVPKNLTPRTVTHKTKWRVKI